MDGIWRWMIMIEGLPQWFKAMFVALFIGHFGTRVFLDLLHWYLGHTPKWREKNIDFYLCTIPAWLLGSIERLFFMILVRFEVQAVSAGIMTWLLIKMVSNWNQIKPAEPNASQREQGKLRIYAITSLLGSLVSMLFAVIGGLIWGGKWPWSWYWYVIGGGVLVTRILIWLLLKNCESHDRVILKWRSFR